MKRTLTCIICPMGCTLNAELENGKVLSVSGNTCPRGAEYAKQECTNPMRTVTSTVRCENGSVVSVKTDRMIPKEKMAECMKKINSVNARLPIYAGDVIIKDVFGSNIIATSSLTK